MVDILDFDSGSSTLFPTSGITSRFPFSLCHNEPKFSMETNVLEWSTFVHNPPCSMDSIPDGSGQLSHPSGSTIPTHCQLRRQMSTCTSQRLGPPSQDVIDMGNLSLHSCAGLREVKAVCGRHGVRPCHPSKVKYRTINGARCNRS